jgi:hypothetical protein
MPREISHRGADHPEEGYRLHPVNTSPGPLRRQIGFKADFAAECVPPDHLKTDVV